jgi:hypothetical protein
MIGLEYNVFPLIGEINVGIQNSVLEIDLFIRNNVHGTIPADLGLLAALTSLIV